MLRWLRDNYKLSIRFHSNVTDPPYFFYDSGHGQYFRDSRAHHRNIAASAGGPVGNESKKHNDLADSTPFNEYMACYHAARKARWWYQFIQELDAVTVAKDIEPILAYLTKDPFILYGAGDDNMADTRVREKRGVPNSRNTRAKDYYIRDVIRATEAQTVSVSNKDYISGAHSKVIYKQTWEFLEDKTSGYEPMYRPSLRSEVLFNLLRVQRERGSVDLYISIVLLAWSLARSDEIDLSAIAVKREILQFVIAYCSLDL